MKLLPDKPISKRTSKSVDFAYEELSKSIAKLISISPRPFTIGLFGRWGTGKSTIIEGLRESLDKREHVFVKFDVWKYESDALRRSFLIDMAEQLKGRHGFAKVNDTYIKRLKNRLYTTTQYDKDKFRFNWRILIVAIVTLGLIVGVYWFINADISLGAAITAVLGLAGIEILKSFLLDKSNFTQQISIGVDRVNSPEEFYREFKAMIDMSKKTFVIVIDNLDRTQKEKTVELLSTVKTFLNADDTNDNVVFLIASDDRAIKEHVSAIYAHSSPESRFDANEFLKKFFNVTIDIPVFIESEIWNYTKKLLNQTDIPEFKNNTDLQQIINYGYRENPREIKQYINNLAAYYVLLSGGVTANGLSIEFIANNLTFICKLLITRHKFERVFAKIQTMVIDESLTWSEVEPKLRELVKGEDKDPDSIKAYLVFSESTGWCTPSDESVSWFFRLRRTPEDQRLPGWDLFVSAALQQDYENAVKLFSDFTDIVALNSQLQIYINKIQGDAAKFTSFFSIYMRVLLASEQTVLDELGNSIDLTFSNTPGTLELNKVITNLDIASIVERLSGYARATSFTKFLRSLSRLLGNPNIVTQESDIIKLIDAVDKTGPKLDSLKPQLRKAIARSHATEAVLRVLAKKDQTLRNELLDNDALIQFFSQILPSESNAVTQFDLLKHFNVTPILHDYLSKLSVLSAEVNARSQPEEKANIVHITYDTLREHTAELKSLQDPGLGSLIRVSEMYAGWYDEQPIDADKAILVLTLVLLTKNPANTAASSATDRLSKFVTQADINEVVELMKNPEIDPSIIQEVQTAIRERMATYPEVVQYLLPFIQPEHISYIISHMSQKAVDTNDENIYRAQLELDHKLYSQVLDSEQTAAEGYIYSALSSGVPRFSNTVKAFWNKKFISTDQRRELKRLMTEHENTLKQNEEQ